MVKISDEKRAVDSQPENSDKHGLSIWATATLAVLPLISGCRAEEDRPVEERVAEIDAIHKQDQKTISSAIPKLIEALKSNQGLVVEAAEEALGRIGAPAVPALVEAWKSSNPKDFTKMAKDLLQLNEEYPWDFRIKEEAENICDKFGKRISTALSMMQDPMAVPAIIKSIKHATSEDFSHLTDYYKNKRDDTKSLSRDSEFRRDSFKGDLKDILEQNNNLESTPHFINALYERDHIIEGNSPVLIENTLLIMNTASNVLQKRGEALPAIKILSEISSDPETPKAVRQFASHKFKKLIENNIPRHPHNKNELIPDPIIRSLKNFKHFENFERIYRDSSINPSLRIAAAEYCGLIDVDKECLNTLIKFANEVPERETDSAIAAIAAMQRIFATDQRLSLRIAIEDLKPSTYELHLLAEHGATHAMLTLARQGDESGFQALNNWLHRPYNNHHFEEVLRTIAEVGAPMIPQLAQGGVETYERMALNAIGAAGKRRIQVPAVTRLLEDREPEVRYWAAHILMEWEKHAGLGSEHRKSIVTTMKERLTIESDKDCRKKFNEVINSLEF